MSSPTATAEQTAERTGDAAAAIRSAAVVLTVATLAASGINYLLNLLLARWMSPSEFGDANLIVTLMLGLTAVSISLQLMAAQRISGSAPADRPWAAERSRLITRAWRIGAALAAAIAVGSPVIRDASSSASAVPFVLLAIGIPFALAQSVERGVLQGLLEFRSLAATLLVEAAARLSIAVLLVAAGFGVTGATAGITASFFASWWSGRRRVRRAATTSASVDTTIDATQSSAADGSTITTRAGQATMILLVGQILINNGDVVIAKLLFDPEQAGVYSVVALIGRAIFFLSWSIVTAAFPHAAQGDDQAFAAVRRQTVRSVAAMSTILTVAVAAAAPRLAPIVFGAAYTSAGSLFAPYAIATSLFAVANASASLGVARGHRRPAMIIVGGAGLQTTMLLGLAGTAAEMVWLQVVAMAALTGATLFAGRARTA